MRPPHIQTRRTARRARGGAEVLRHFQQTDHPIMRSAEPGEQWSWCYLDELMFQLRTS
jgi:hypothetical protein